MKKIITTTGLLIAVLFTANAQHWERGNDRHEDHSANQVIYRGDENKRGYDRDDRRGNDRDNYYRGERREYYREQPRVVYHRDYCSCLI